METKKKKQFVKPTIKEVEDYMLMKKPDWPLTFIEFYAAKFWNSYESQGWKLSNGNAMKNWQACFNNNWQELKYNYIGILHEHKAKEIGKQAPVIIEKKNGEFTPEFMDQVLIDFKKNYHSITDETLASYYPWMKERKAIHLTTEEKQDIVLLYSEKLVQGMAACVRATFTKMINYGVKFSSNGKP